MGTTGDSYLTVTADDNGNLTVVTPAAPELETRLRYDSENRLVHVEGAKSADLQYDPLGRLWRVSGGAAGATRFYYDGDKLVFEMADSGALRHFYVHGDGVDQPLVWWDFTGANTRRFLHADQQGSIVAVSNGQTGGLVMVGTVPAINSYDPWGVPGADNMPGLRFGYTGQAWLPELGMYYYKARIYWPMLGRFLQVDPIGYDDQTNLYAYVGNDPLNKADPTGLCIDNTCPVSAIWGSTEYNLKVRQTEERAGIVGVPILAVALASPAIYLAIDSAAVAIGGRAFQVAQSGLRAAERTSAEGLSRTVVSRMTTIRNIITNNGTRGDFVGAARESRGIATGYNHIKEMRQSIRGLNEAIQGLQGSLKNPNLSAETRATLQTWRNAGQSAIRAMRKALNE